MNKSKLREQIAKTISECPYWDKLESERKKPYFEMADKVIKAILEEVRIFPRYPTTEMATYENGYNEGHNNAIIDIIQMLERQKLSILKGEK